jgi:hypothetical protein
MGFRYSLNSKTPYLLLMIFSIIAFCFIYFTSIKNNLGVSVDSSYYIEGARNLKSKLEFINNNGTLINHWPPFYPILLALFSSLVGGDILNCGPLFNAIACALLFAIFNLILIKRNAKVFTIILLNLFLLFSYPLQIFSMYWSEVPFIVILYFIFYLFIGFEIPNNRYIDSIILGLLCGVLVLTRYAGLPFVLALGLYFLFFAKSSLKSRILNTLFFSITFGLLLSIWIFYTRSFGHSTTGRNLFMHIISLSELKPLVLTIGKWFSPFNYIWSAGMILVLAIIVFLFRSDIQHFVKSYVLSLFKDDYYILTLSFIIFYIAFLIISISFFDAATPLDNRILSPIYPFVLFLIQPVVDQLSKVKKVFFRSTIYFIIIILLAGYIKQGTSYWQNFRENGLLFTNRAWKNSELLKNMSHYGNFKIYTNATELVPFYFPNNHLDVFALPFKYSPNNNQINHAYFAQIAQLKENVLEKKAVIIFFNSIQRRYWSSENGLKKYFNTAIIDYYPDGFLIYGK